VNLDASANSTRPEFFSYGGRHDRLLLFPALAVKITDWLSAGLGASITLDASGGTTIEGGLTSDTTTEFEIELEPDAGVVFGVLLTPADWISFGVTYRSELSMTIDFPAEAILEGIALPLDLKTVQSFSPHQVQVGLAVDLSDSLLVTLDFAWVNWSAYESAFLEVKSGVASVVEAEDVDLDDVFSPKLGVEVLTTDWLLLRGGYMYRTSAIPDQSDEVTNLVDSPKHVFTLGVGFAFGSAPDAVSDEAKESKQRSRTLDEALSDASLDVDLVFQWHLHERVSADKPSGDAVGDWDADGSVINLGIAVTGRF
jgi:long-subunit fatty acid transport protein